MHSSLQKIHELQCCRCIWTQETTSTTTNEQRKTFWFKIIWPVHKNTQWTYQERFCTNIFTYAMTKQLIRNESYIELT